MIRRSPLALAALSVAAPTLAQSPKTLRVVMHSDLEILDLIWTTAYIVRNHGYLIYDTLFALDAKPQPRNDSGCRPTGCCLGCAEMPLFARCKEATASSRRCLSGR